MTLRVIYVMGLGRSGTTVLDLALAQAAAVPSAGELALVWRRGLIEDRLCSCGARFSACEFWQGVVGTAPAIFDRRTAERVQETLARVGRWWVPFRCRSRRARARLRREVAASWREAMTALYEGFAAQAGSATFVDSSKGPVLAWLLADLEGLRLLPVHAVRDPRSVAASWAAPFEDPAAPPLPSLSPLRTAVVWNLVEAASRRVMASLGTRGATVRYEDLIRAPEEVVRHVLGAVGVQAAAPAGSQLDPSAHHTISGHPALRLAVGPVSIAPQRLRRLRLGPELAVTACNLLGLRRYGYSLCAAREGVGGES